jgi:hypothetical protein
MTRASGSFALGAGATLSYGEAGTLAYAGSVAQTAATAEFPSSSGPYNLTITNSAGVSMGALSRTINGMLTLVSGALANAGQLTLGNGATISRDTGTLSAAPTFGTTVNVTYGGSSTAVTTSNEIPVNETVLNNLTVNKSGGVTLNASAAVNGTLTLTSGALAIGAYTLTNNGAISVTSGTLTGGGSSDMTFGGAGAATALPAVSGGLRNLTINRANGIDLGGDLTLGGTLTLTSGSFGVGANTLTLNGPAIAGTAANLVTTSSSSLSLGGSSSSVAIPSSVSALNNLTINNANGVTLSGSPTVNGTLTLTSGKITTGGNTLTVASAGLVVFVRRGETGPRVQRHGVQNFPHRKIVELSSADDQLHGIDWVEYRNSGANRVGVPRGGGWRDGVCGPLLDTDGKRVQRSNLQYCA